MAGCPVLVIPSGAKRSRGTCFSFLLATDYRQLFFWQPCLRSPRNRRVDRPPQSLEPGASGTGKNLSEFLGPLGHTNRPAVTSTERRDPVGQSGGNYAATPKIFGNNTAASRR